MKPATFLLVWLSGYRSPVRLVEGLRDKPAPSWGFYAQLIRAAMDALLLYLPLALMGEQPSTPSYLTFITSEGYFAVLVWLAPVFLLCQWLLLSAILHLTLRLSGQRSDIDQILNITGMAALVVGAFLVAWDWLWILVGWQNVVLLGVSHLLLDGWGLAITVIGFKRILGMPVYMGTGLSLLWIVLGLPLAMLFMRGPF